MPVRFPILPKGIHATAVLAASKGSARNLVVMSAALGCAVFGALSLVTPRYQSQAAIAIVAQGGTKTRPGKAAIEAHMAALRSPGVISKVVADLKLAEHAEFNAALGSVDTFDSVLRLFGIGASRGGDSARVGIVNAVRDQLEVLPTEDGGVIGIRVTSVDPQLAARIANQTAEAYRAVLAANVDANSDEQQAQIQANIDKLSPEVAALETQVDRIRSEIASARGGSQNAGAGSQQRSDLENQLTNAKAERSALEVRVRSARDMMKSGSSRYLPDVQKSPLLHNLVQQRVRMERQVSELSAILRPTHPRVRQLSAELAGVKQQIGSEMGYLVESLDKEARIAQAREEKLQKSLDEMKTRAAAAAPDEARLNQLEAGAKAKRAELDRLRAQFAANRTKLASRAPPLAAQIVSSAQPSSSPAFPHKASLAFLLALASLLLGTAWTVTRTALAGMRGPEDGASARPLEGVSPPGAVPRSGSKSIETATPRQSVDPLDRTSPAEGMSHTAMTGGNDAIAKLAAQLVAARSSHGGHRVLVTGETNAIDPAREANALAGALSQSGAHVILVEWDRGSESADEKGFDSARLGLNDLITGHAGFEDTVSRALGSDVHVLAPGTPLARGLEPVDSEQLNLVLDALDEAYDHIIVSGRHDEARALFEAILGRFDAGIMVPDEKMRRVSVLDESQSTFLGFDVADIEVIRLPRTERRTTGGLDPAPPRPIAAVGADPLMRRA